MDDGIWQYKLQPMVTRVLDEMSSLLQEHCQLIKEIFSQSLSGNAYAFLPPDFWIECTMSKSSKLQAGWKDYWRMK